MSDKPIIFSAPMIRALLAGTKTQTRRLVKFSEFLTDQKPTGELVNYYGDHRIGMALEDTTLVQPLPIAPGDRLWVREQAAGWMTKPSIPVCGGTVSRESLTYRADMTDEEWQNLLYDRRTWRRMADDRQDRPGGWVLYSPIHMPRRASRLTLTVTDVRVQRLQEISEADAIAEGVPPDREGAGTFIGRQGPGRWVTPWPTATEAFADLWNSIHGASAWDQNPWVYALTFTVHRCNIDQMEV